MDFFRRADGVSAYLIWQLLIISYIEPGLAAIGRSGLKHSVNLFDKRFREFILCVGVVRQINLGAMRSKKLLLSAIFITFVSPKATLFDLSLRRNISANVLLSIVLSIVFLAPFHHHQQPLLQEISCDDCTHHQPHPGHLSEKPGTDECVICQLLAQVYVPTAGPVVSDLFLDCITTVSDFCGDVILPFTSPSSPRAPPVSFCF